MNKIDEVIKRTALRESEQLADLLRNTDMHPASTMSIRVFERVALPFLRTVHNDEEFNGEQWAATVAHPNSELHVIDDNGALIYNIPPLLDQQRTMDIDGFKYANTIAQLNSLASDNPNLAHSFIYNNISKLADKDYDPTEPLNKMVTALNKVFADYKMPLLKGADGKVPDSVETTEAKEALDNIEFEDF